MRGRRLYVFAYDIQSDRRRYRIAKALEKRGLRVQESVFELRGRQEEMTELAARIKRLMMPGDSLRVYPVPKSVLAHCIAHGGPPVAERGDYYIF